MIRPHGQCCGFAARTVSQTWLENTVSETNVKGAILWPAKLNPQMSHLTPKPKSVTCSNITWHALSHFGIYRHALCCNLMRRQKILPTRLKLIKNCKVTNIALLLGRDLLIVDIFVILWASKATWHQVTSCKCFSCTLRHWWGASSSVNHMAPKHPSESSCIDALLLAHH